MPIYPLDDAFEQEAEHLSYQVIVTQFFGTFLLVWPTLWLPGRFITYGAIGAYFVLVYTFVFFFIWHRDWLFRPPILPIHRLNRIRNSLEWLVWLDSVVIVLAIAATGGVTQSHLTGVLLLIPCVMSIVAIKPSVFVRISVVLGIVLSIGLLFYKRPGEDPLVIAYRKLGLFFETSSSKTGYLQAVTSVAILSIVLVVIERYISKPRLPSDYWSFAEIKRLRPGQYEKPLVKCVNKGFNRYKRRLEETNISDPHISLVHNPQAVFSQAYILAYPSYRRRNLRDAERIAFVTFATHWIDDCFDGIYNRDVLDKLTVEKARALDSEKLCHLMKDLEINIMRRYILKKCAKDKELVDSGLFRVMLAGLIQHAAEPIEEVLTELYREVYKIKLDVELAEKIDSLDRTCLLAMARTSLGLILGCESPKKSEKREDLTSLACIFDLILCPLVLFHDLETEAKWEEGILPECNESLFNKLIEMAKLAVQKLPAYINQDVMRGAVRVQQLRLVRDLYLELVPKKPEFKDPYKAQLEEFIEIFAKG